VIRPVRALRTGRVRGDRGNDPRDLAAVSLGGLGEQVIGTRDNAGVSPKSGRKMHGVVAPKSVGLGQGAGVANEIGGHGDDRELSPDLLEVGLGCSVLGCGQPLSPLSRRECRPCPAVRDLDGHGDIGAHPECIGSGNADLVVEDEREKDRRVDVGDHRRWSATSSATVPGP
jgi:hypothetical protein